MAYFTFIFSVFGFSVFHISKKWRNALKLTLILLFLGGRLWLSNRLSAIVNEMKSAMRRHHPTCNTIAFIISQPPHCLPKRWKNDIKYSVCMCTLTCKRSFRYLVGLEHSARSACNITKFTISPTEFINRWRGRGKKRETWQRRQEFR